MEQQVTESSASLSIDVKATARHTEPEPHLDASCPTDGLNKSKKKQKKKKKQKNRRQSLDKNEVEKIKEELEEEDDGDKTKETGDEGLVVEVTAPVEVAATEIVVTKEDNHEEEATDVEPASSLITLKASGTRAVGSLLSRFKLGRRKSLSSETESATKMELVIASPVETAEKRRHVSEEMILNDVVTRTKRERVGEREQNVPISVEKDKAESLEEQRKQEKKAMQSTPSAAKSNDGVQTMVEAKAQESKVVDSLVHLSLDDTVELDGHDLGGSAGADFDIDVSSEGIVESMVEVDAAAVPERADENVPIVIAAEMLMHEKLITLETIESPNEQTITTKDQDENVLAPSEIIAEGSTGRNQRSADVVMVESVPLKLDLDLDMNQSKHTDTTENQVEVVVAKDVGFQLKEAAVETFVTETVEAVASNASDQSEAITVEPLVADMIETTAPKVQKETTVSDETVVNSLVTEFVNVVEFKESLKSKAISTDSTELPAAKVTPPTSDLPGIVASPAKPKRMSPVKSLASRFEGKREQSLDSLKFRTVREFFSEERSIRVGAEKKKYEAQAQQQKLKAMAEEEAKSKYKAGSGFKSPEKEAVVGASSLELENPALIVQESVMAGAARADPVVLTTPDTAARRKKLHFNDGYAAADSPSKSSDDAQESLTPVKSIASRFEGKHEQSLDSLRFRTVREFFPDEGKRSIHVGAEKAKFEALRKQQEEAMMTVEHCKSKVSALLPTSTTVKRESFAEASSADALLTTHLPALDEACNDMATKLQSLGLSKPEDGAAVESVDDNVEVVAVVGLNVDGKTGATVEKKCLEASSTGTDTASIIVIKEDRLASRGVHGRSDTVVAEPVFASDGKLEATVEVNEETKLAQETGKVLSVCSPRLVELDPGEVGRRADVDTTGDYHVNNHASYNIVENAKIKEAQDIESKIDSELGKLSVAGAVGHNTAELDGGVIQEGNVGDQVNVLQTPGSQNLVQVVDEEATNSEHVESNFGKPVQGDQIDSSISSTGEATIADGENASMGIQQFAISKKADLEPRSQVVESAISAENGDMELDVGEFAAKAWKEQMNRETKESSVPILTTEQLFVMEENHTIETVETVVVGERPMTDGEDDIEFLSPTNVRSAHELHAGVTSSKPKKTSINKTLATASPKLTRKVSAMSAGIVQPMLAKPAVSMSVKRAPTASCMAKKTLEAKKLQVASPQLKKKGSASDSKGTVIDTGSIKPLPAAPTVPASRKRASIIKRTTSSQARDISDHAGEASHSLLGSTSHVSEPKGAVGIAGFMKPSPPTGPVAPRRGSIGVLAASYTTKRAAEHVQDIKDVAPSVSARNKKYTNVKSKVLAGIQSGSLQTVGHKTITKEEFIAAERRKSLGSAGIRSVLGAADRRASLAAGATIDGPPEPFVRSALSRKKLNSTLPRYMNYENTPGYAERARQQYERRRRLEEENAAKSEKRQRELRTFFADRQHTSLRSSTDEGRRGLEAYEFAKVAKENRIADRKAMKAERQRSGPTRSFRRATSATSSAGTSSSNGVLSRTSKKSSLSSVAVTAEATVMETEEATESGTFVTGR